MTRQKSKREGLEETVDVISAFGYNPFEPIGGKDKQKSILPFEIPFNKQPSFNPFLSSAVKQEKTP